MKIKIFLRDLKLPKKVPFQSIRVGAIRVPYQKLVHTILNCVDAREVLSPRDSISQAMVRKRQVSNASNCMSVI